jgi:hypothetical protein
MTSLQQILGSWRLPGALFLCYAGASILWSPGDQIWATTILCSFVAAFVAGTYVKDTKIVWSIFTIFIVFNILSMLFIDEVPWGLFGNPNYLGCAIVMALVGAIVHKFYWFLPVGVIGLYFTHSRGAILAAGIMSVVAIWRHSKWIAFIVVLLIVPIIVETKSGDDASTLLARLGVWQDTLNHLTFFGHGFNSFFTTYQTWPVHTNMTLQLPTHPYNDALEALFDFGIGSVFLWTTLILLWDKANPGQRLIFITFFALGLTYYPLHIIPVGLLFFMTLGHATKGASYEVASRHASPYRRASA